MPRFSIVIPTLRRPDTLRHSLVTALAQTCGDFEIVVQNNGRDAETDAVLREADDPRIRHCGSESVLTMTENWEEALANARGDMITFIGDDDGLFPDACQSAVEIFDRTGTEIVNWRPFCYYWPNYLHPELRNRLIAVVDYDSHLQIVSSQDQLRRFYHFAIDYSQLPMIYNSFVRRSVIERITAATGRYFLGFSPDMTSGIVNAAHTMDFTRVSRPLSMTGLSQHSTGHNTLLSSREHVSADQIERDFGPVRMDDRLVASNNLQMFLANDMLFVRDRVPSMRGRVDFDFFRLIQLIAAAINDRPGFYQATLAAIRMLAKRHAIDLSGIAIPALLAEKQPLKHGATLAGGSRVQFVIDGNAIPLVNIADAIRLMEQFIPHTSEIGAIEVRDTRGADRAAVRRGEALAFGLGGNGLSALGDGWGEPEEWGTWSVAKQASLRLAVEPAGGEPLHGDLRYRAFFHESRPRLDFACRVRGREIAAWSCTIAAPSGIQRLTIPIEIVAPDGIVEFEFSVSDPRSPAEFGINTDQRPLGIGIEKLSFPI